MIEVALPGVRALFTTRAGGQSEGSYASRNLGVFTKDDEDVVRANIAQLESELELPPAQLLRQVHGAEVVDVDERTRGTVPIGDAAFTTQRQTPLLITGADCPTVVIAGGGAVAAVHCGWRSVSEGIIERVAVRFAESGFSAAIGPGICVDHFEVGPEVVERIGVHGPLFSEGRQLDLRGVIARRLEDAGAESVHDVDRCTYCEPEMFFSYRRDGDATGRQAGVAWLV